MDYLTDSYLKECDATVVEVVNEKGIVLDRTCFYPQGGGQPYDTGTLTKGSEKFKVVSVKKVEGKVVHEVDTPGLNVNEGIHGKIDWERRYTLMRHHTAAHILSGVLNKEGNVLITGNQLDVDKSRMDFDVPEFTQEKIDELFRKANEIVEKDLPINVYYMDRSEAEQQADLVKLAKGLPLA